MQDNSDKVGQFLVAGLILGTLIMAAGHGLPNWNWSFEAWFGTKPIMDYVISSVTLCAAGVGAWIALSTLRMNIQAGFAARFQKGLELLASSSEATQIGGLSILEDVVRLKPRTYLAPLCLAMISRIAEEGRDAWLTFYTEKKLPPVSHDSTIVAFRAICALARTQIDHRWKGDVIMRPDDPLVVFRPYLNMITFRDLDFTRIDIRAGAFGLVSFENCTFRKCSFSVKLRRTLMFENCIFDDVDVKRTNLKVPFPGKVTIAGLRAGSTLRVDGKAISADGTF